VAVFGRLPSIEDVALSPGGARIAFVNTTAENQRVVAVVSLTDRKVVGMLQAGDAKLRGLEWLDEDHLLLKTSATAVPSGLMGLPHECFMLQVYDVARHEVRPLLGAENRTMNVTFGRTMVRRVDGHTVLFVNGYYVTDRSLPGLFRIDLSTGHEDLVRKGSAVTRGWLVDEAGEVVAEEDYREREQRWGLRIPRAGSLDEVATYPDQFGLVRIVSFGPTGESVVVLIGDKGGPEWKALSLKDGTWSPKASRSSGRNVIVDRFTDRMIGWAQGDDSEYTFLDSALQDRWDAITRNFHGERVRLVSTSDDRMKFVVLVDGQQSGYTYELADLVKHQIEPLGPVYAGLPDLSEVRPITYLAADGLRLRAYVTLPRGRPQKGLPLIVFPHGGPASHDMGAFDWWAQALAARGYVVLQPNYRGSDVDSTLLSAGFGEWGRKMQTDLSDGVRFLAREGMVDPARVCIVGASYGGYAALAGVTLDPGVYRCAASVAGISDLKRFLEWVNEKGGRRDTTARRWWDRFMGVSGPGDPTLEALSPIRHVEQVSGPVLLVHGRDDTVVPYEQSAVMAVALERAGKTVELVALDEEDHWLSRGASRLRMLEHVLAFLAVHNPSE
jgi:dipeptidyl aminopeptidase/acylaminoacyl peptidase